MVQVQLKRPEALTADERGVWRDMLMANPDLISPYFSLGYVDAVGAARSDIFIAVIRETDQITGFFSFQKGPLGHARPPGGILNDCNGLVKRPSTEIDVQALLKPCNIEAYDFVFALGNQRVFHNRAKLHEGGWVIDLSKGYDAYTQSRKKLGGGTFRSITTSLDRLKKDHDVAIRIEDRRPEALEALYTWKSRQYKVSGYTDLFKLKWPRVLIETLLENKRVHGSGILSSIEIDGRLAAVHMGMINAHVIHYWFPAYDPELESKSPGNALMVAMMRHAAEMGLKEFHLGAGESRQKKSLGSFQMPLAEGCFTRPGLMGWGRAVAGQIETVSEKMPLGPVSGLPGKVFRRIDQIAALHGG